MRPTRFIVLIVLVVWLVLGGEACRRRRRSATPSSTPSGGALTNQCLDCICTHGEQGGGSCPNNAGCNWDVNSYSCGPYQIKEPYYRDCGSPGSSWRSCTQTRSCSQTCVRAYLRRYGTHCTNGRAPTCEDYARIHNGGPTGCRMSSTAGYWQKVKRCCDARGGC